MPRWQVARMWLGGFKSHVSVLMHINEMGAATLRHLELLFSGC